MQPTQSNFGKPNLQESWCILCNSNSWKDPNDLVIQKQTYGYESADDLTYLTDREVNELSERLSLISKRKFMQLMGK